MATRHYLVVAVVAFLAAFAGLTLGRQILPMQPQVESELHRMLHEELDLDARQKTRIHQLEQRFQQRRSALEEEMRQDNIRLAEAIKAEHGFGPQVGMAVDQSHHAMGELQKESLRHIFAMRDELRPDQAKRFEAAVVAALTTNEK